MPIFHAESIGRSGYEFHAPSGSPPESGCALVAGSGSGTEYNLGWSARPVLIEPSVDAASPTDVLTAGGSWEPLPEVTSGAIASALGYVPANKAGDTFTGAVAVQGDVSLRVNDSLLFGSNFFVNRTGIGGVSVATSGKYNLHFGNQEFRANSVTAIGFVASATDAGAGTCDATITRLATGPAIQIQAAGGLRVTDLAASGYYLQARQSGGQSVLSNSFMGDFMGFDTQINAWKNFVMQNPAASYATTATITPAGAITASSITSGSGAVLEAASGFNAAGRITFGTDPSGTRPYQIGRYASDNSLVYDAWASHIFRGAYGSQIAWIGNGWAFHAVSGAPMGWDDAKIVRNATGPTFDMCAAGGLRVQNLAGDALGTLQVQTIKADGTVGVSIVGDVATGIYPLRVYSGSTELVQVSHQGSMSLIATGVFDVGAGYGHFKKTGTGSGIDSYNDVFLRPGALQAGTTQAVKCQYSNGADAPITAGAATFSGPSGTPSTANSLMVLRDTTSNIGFQMGATSGRGWIRSVDVGVSFASYGILNLGNGYISLGSGANESQLYIDTNTGAATFIGSVKASRFTISSGDVLSTSGVYTVLSAYTSNPVLAASHYGYAVLPSNAGIGWNTTPSNGWTIAHPETGITRIASGVVGAVAGWKNTDPLANLIAKEYQQAYNGSITPSARHRMLATGQRISEVGDGAGAWGEGYREKFEGSVFKSSVYGVTEVARATTGISGATLVSGSGTALHDDDTFDGYTVGQIVKALRNWGLLT